MEGQVHHVEGYPTNTILREDDHQARQSTYLEVKGVDFAFNDYGHGTREQKQKYGITNKLFRYFNKRRFLFHRFDEGIALDEESWYSVIPESVSHYLSQRFKQCKVNKIFEPFCGVGGIAIHLCDQFGEFVVNDLDTAKIKMLKHNLRVYGKGIRKDNILNRDFLEVEPFRTDALIICPPWGGIDTMAYSTGDLDELMFPKLSDILVHARKFSENIMLQLPKQTNMLNLLKVVHQVGLKPVMSVEKIMTNGKCSQLFFYFGSEAFTGVNTLQLHTALYRDLGVTLKPQKKRAKEMLSARGKELMGEVYKVRCPHKITYFTD